MCSAEGGLPNELGASEMFEVVTELLSCREGLCSCEDEEGNLRSSFSVDLGQGKPSSLAIHIGQEEGGKLYVQQSTGTIRELLLKTPFRMKSGGVVWYEE